MTTLDTLSPMIAELQTWAFSTVLSVPDSAAPDGSRPPLLTEISAMELSVFLVEGTTYTYLTAWTYSAGTWAAGATVLKNLNIANTGRGVYVEATGLLTVTLHAGDNPCVGTGTTPGATEVHEALVTVRYNADADQLAKRIRFSVENLNKVPREP